MTDVTDDFNRANGSLGANWIDSPSFTGLTIVSNAVSSATSAWRMAYWNPLTNTFANDQHAQITIGAGAGGFAGAVARHQSGASTSCYVAFTTIGVSGQFNLYRVDLGGFVSLGLGATTTVNPGDTISIDATGTTIRGFLNGVSQVSVTDATYTSGQPGIAAFNQTLDNFAGGPTFGTTTLMGAMWQ